MAKKLNEDQIKWILSLDASEAEKGVNELTKKNTELTNRNKELRKSMQQLEMQGKKGSAVYLALSEEYSKNTKQISSNREMMKRLDEQMGLNNLSMVQLKRRAQDLQKQLDTTSQALHPQEWEKLNQQLTDTKNRMSELKDSGKAVESQFQQAAKSVGKWSAFFGNLYMRITDWGIHTLGRMKDITAEGITMAESADGVQRAFDKLDNGQILNNLRKATKGTVTDLDLMKATVQAKDFRIPLEDLGKYLQFAQLKAQQTGQSVDYMTSSIITGLGRKSVLILDNLGLSAAEINEQISQTGDFMSAVASIVDKQLAAAGDNYVSSADRAQAASVRFKNAQLELGKTILPFKENWDELYTGVSVGTMELISWAVKHRNVLATLVTAYTAYKVATRLATTETYKGMAATKASVILDKMKLAWISNAKGITLLYAAAKAKLTGNILRANAAMKLFNATCKANVIGLVVSAVVTAISYFTLFRAKTDEVTEAQRKMNDELEHTKQTLEKVAGIKVSAENIQFLTDKQKQQMKADAQQSIDELENLITKGMIANKQWYETEKQSLLKLAGDNEVLKKSYLNGLEHDLKERMKVIAGYIDEKKKLEKIVNSMPDEQAQDLVKAKQKEIEEAEKIIASTREEVEARNKKVAALKAELEVLQNLGIQKKKTDESAGERNKEKEQLEADKKLIAEVTTLRDKALADEERKNTAALNAHRLMLHNKQLTEQQYAIWETAYASNLADRRLSIEEKYAHKIEALAIANVELKEQAVKDAGKRVEQAEQQSFDTRLKAEQVFRSNMDALQEMAQKTSVTPEVKLKAEYETQLQLLEAYYKASLKYAEEYGQNEAEIAELYNQAKLNLETKYQEEKKKLVEKKNEEIKALQGNDISQQFTDIFNNIEQLKESIANADFEGMLQSIQGIVNTVLGGLSNAFNTFKQIEIDSIEAKYDAEIEAAQGNTEEVERLEQEKAQKKLDIEKKYADVQFAVKASQIIANTALAIMMAYGQLGPIAGPIAAALMAATGAVQLAAANAERQKVKNMTLSGSESSSGGTGARVATGRQSGGKIDVRRAQDGKLFPNSDYDPDARGFIDHPTVIVGEGPAGQSKEWVASNAAVSNPTVAPILDILDKSQQAGTIRTLDLNQVIRTRMAGYSSGGSIGNPMPVSSIPTNDSGAILPPELMKRFANAIVRLDEEGLPPAPVLLSEIEKKQELRNRSRAIGSKK